MIYKIIHPDFPGLFYSGGERGSFVPGGKCYDKIGHAKSCIRALVERCFAYPRRPEDGYQIQAFNLVPNGPPLDVTIVPKPPYVSLCHNHFKDDAGRGRICILPWNHASRCQ